jgi:hypothetical protein
VQLGSHRLSLSESREGGRELSLLPPTPEVLPRDPLLLFPPPLPELVVVRPEALVLLREDIAWCILPFVVSSGDDAAGPGQGTYKTALVIRRYWGFLLVRIEKIKFEGEGDDCRMWQL